MLSFTALDHTDTNGFHKVIVSANGDTNLTVDPASSAGWYRQCQGYATTGNPVSGIVRQATTATFYKTLPTSDETLIIASTHDTEITGMLVP